MSTNSQCWKVCVRCFTYNQAPYITDTLNGFTMQQTDFPFVCIVMDDASTDGEQTVIENYVKEHFDLSNSAAAYQKETDYAHITFARHKTNKNCYFAVLYLKENHYSKKKSKLPYLAEWQDGAEYIAFCEGDDYWTAPFKLQKQVDFLDSHPDYGLCYTDFNIIYQGHRKAKYDVFKNYPKRFPKSYTLEEWILRSGYVCPPSWLMRKALYPQNPIISLDGSFVIFTHYLCTTKVHLLEATTSVYRTLKESASHSSDADKMYRRAINLLETQFKLIDRYSVQDKEQLKHKCEHRHYATTLPSFIAYHRDNDVKRAKQILRPYSFRNRVLFMIQSLRLQKILRLLLKIKRSY